MQLEFAKNMLPYLRRTVWEVKHAEQTQEVKLTESLPDIGRILGAWGQPLVRSKEWRGSSMSVSGGIMAWVLYAPEEGAAQCVETWIPFQVQWELPQSKYDGVIRVDCLLKGMDARSLSARRMMVRTVVSVAGEALEPAQADWYQPAETPEDIQLLHNTYPVRLPAEAGEKSITINEELTPGNTCGPVKRIVCCHLHPELTDQKVMADKVVFHGSAKVAMLYEGEDAQLHSCDFEIPFSQYAELEKEYDSGAVSDVIPALTNLETDVLENGTVHLKAGLIGQYVIYDRHMLDVVTDAYSPERQVITERQKLELPAVLDMKQEKAHVEVAGDLPMTQIIHTGMQISHPLVKRADEECVLEIPGKFQILGQNEAGNALDSNLHWEKSMGVCCGANSCVIARCAPAGKPQPAGNGCVGAISVEMLITALTDIPMVSSMELGEKRQPDADRPSLILRRAGNTSLWELAKSCGSTVEKITQANALTGEPEADKVLLIPIA